MVDEPDFTPDEPTADQKALLELRADLFTAYKQAVASGQLDEADELREEARSLTLAEVRKLRPD